MGLSHYVYPGAIHTRFHHALGAMHLMEKAMNTLRTKGVEISDNEAEAAMIAILLHDIGHGPYSHTLERVLVNKNHEELTLAYMHRLNEQFDGELEEAISIFDGSHERKFLHQLITGQLDLDRMDYLKRDSFFSGVVEGNIGHDRIIYMLDVRNDQIVVEEKGIFSIEQFLFARKLMYWQVYLHKTSLAAEIMLRQTMTMLRQEVLAGRSFDGVPAPLINLLKEDFTHSDAAKVLEPFSVVDDVDVVYALKQLVDDSNPVLRMLSRRLLSRRLFATKLMTRDPGQLLIEQLEHEASRTFDLTREHARFMVFPGFEAIPTYKTSSDEIKMLLKTGEVVPFSKLRSMNEDSVTNQHFVCFPKELRKAFDRYADIRQEM